MSNNRGVEQYNCTGEERHLVSILVAAGLDHSVAPAAFLNLHSFMEGVGGVVHDGQQFGRHPVLHHLCQGCQPTTEPPFLISLFMIWHATELITMI